jgi:Predicted sugar phosphate isomerase involved in capsule formation
MVKGFEDTLRILSESLKTVDENMFKKLLDRCCLSLSEGKKVVVSGLGKNVPICEKFVGTMNSLGMDAVFLNTNSAVHGDMGIVKQEDVVIILTKSGETAESVYLAQLLKYRKVYMWLLSFERNSTLAEIIPDKLILDLEHEGDMWNIMPNNSTTLNLIILQNLAMRIAEERKISLEVFKSNHPGGHIGKLLS